MWSISSTDTYDRRLKRNVKDRPRELAAAISNLQTYFVALQDGVKPLQLRERFRFVHNEGEGVYAVDQKGGGKALTELRLYLFADVEEKVLYLLTIGDKNTQKRDIQDCREMIADIPRRGNKNVGQTREDQTSQEREVP